LNVIDPFMRPIHGARKLADFLVRVLDPNVKLGDFDADRDVSADRSSGSR
jgi:hypothetical protein